MYLCVWGWRAVDRPGKLTELKDKSHQRLDKMVVCQVLGGGGGGEGVGGEVWMCVCGRGGRGLEGRCGCVCVCVSSQVKIFLMMDH